ncbi:hypothetical protein GH808_11420 [Acetobacterium fimetarium]|uniref:Anti-sigma factor RsgI-like middle domain-containing protein n=1 Tax=Acetobacterium fimetarium TaxID=52691 RepID=A0ABR6WWS3_9FIRM|nr:hypothetical protein [Acetobacterium fimetarium]MBC3805041.1 hypothetical protein [Acetobacterium fimetarium]
MNTSDIEKSIRHGISQAPLLDFAKLAAMPVVKMTEHDYITRQPARVKRRPRYFRQLSSAVACCAVAVVCYSGWYIQFRSPDSTVALDVNPSIEIVTNRHNQVLSVRALNDDAKKIVADLDFDQADLDESVDALVSSMIDQGYLNADRNVVLVSVANKDADKADDLAVAVDHSIKDSAASQDIEPTVLRQTLTETDDETAALADQYSVSTGKIKLVQEIAAADETLTVDALAGKSVTELLQISIEKAVDLNKIVQFDEPATTPDSKADSAAAVKETIADPVVPADPATTEPTAVKETQTVPSDTAAVNPAKTGTSEAETVTLPTPSDNDNASANESASGDEPVVTPPPAAGTDSGASTNESDLSDPVVTRPAAGSSVIAPTETGTVPAAIPVE